MRTSHLLPEECKAEIRQEIKAHEGAKEIMMVLKVDSLFIHAVERDIEKLKWVLNDKEGAEEIIELTRPKPEGFIGPGRMDKEG